MMSEMWGEMLRVASRFNVKTFTLPTLSNLSDDDALRSLLQDASEAGIGQVTFTFMPAVREFPRAPETSG